MNYKSTGNASSSLAEDIMRQAGKSSGNRLETVWKQSGNSLETAFTHPWNFNYGCSTMLMMAILLWKNIKFQTKTIPVITDAMTSQQNIIY